MSKTYKIGVLFILATIVLFASLTNMVLAQEESTSSANVDEKVVMQNLKDRLASQSGILTKTKRKIAFIGSIEKIANDTLTIKTKDDIKLASTSATTSYVRLPNNSTQELEDISIGDYAIAMGYVNGSEVLETKRVILQDTPPSPTKKTSSAGIISYIEEDEGVIHILFDNKEVSVEVTKNTDLYIQNQAVQEEIGFSDLEKGQFISAIYIPIADADEFTHPKALSILATNIFKEVPSDLPSTASESAVMEETEPTTPPELSL